MEPLPMPGSKSLTHRAIILGAATDGPCRIDGALRSDDTNATLDCVMQLGADVEADGTTLVFDEATPRRPDGPLDCRNAGTGLRLLTAQAALRDDPITLTGDASLRSRPNGPLLGALRSLRVHVQGDDQAPFTVRGPLRPGHVSMPASTSSQFASALLLALPQAAGESSLVLEPPLSSNPYLDLTLEVSRAFGLSVHERDAEGRAFEIPGLQRPRASHFAVEADWSTAAFPLVAGALLGEANVSGLNPESRQGDRAILDVLRAFGAPIALGDSIRVSAAPLVSPGRIDVSDTPDTFPILCILAAASQGTTEFVGGAALRHKESDRIAAMAAGLAQLGIQTQQRPDGLVVTGGRLGGGSVATHGDHRIHMAFAIANCIATGDVCLDHPESVAVSYPDFYQHLARIQEAP